jgi:hypothetical protein
MANVIHLTCRTLASSPCYNGFSHIAHVGWFRDTGESGKADLQAMVTWLADPNNEAYSRAPGGQTARVQVLRCGSHQYLETDADHTKLDNLRELPTC